MPSGKRAKSNSSASAQCTVSFQGGKVAARLEARSRSSSIASSFATFSSSGAVSAPSPGPISIRTSSGKGPMAATMRATTPFSWRKCCPNRLRGRCELDGKLQRLGKAARIGAPGAGEVERGAVIDGGAHERQAERDVHAAAEGSVLEHRQALIVIHGEHAGGALQALRHEKRVRRQRADRVDAGFRRLRDRGRDDVAILGAEVARFAAVRVQSRDQDARLLDADTK